MPGGEAGLADGQGEICSCAKICACGSNFGDALLNRFLDHSQGYAYGVNVTSIKYGDTELLNFLPGHDAYVGEFDSGTTSASPPPNPFPYCLHLPSSHSADPSPVDSPSCKRACEEGGWN